MEKNSSGFPSRLTRTCAGSMALTSRKNEYLVISYMHHTLHSHQPPVSSKSMLSTQGLAVLHCHRTDPADRKHHVEVAAGRNLDRPVRHN